MELNSLRDKTQEFESLKYGTKESRQNLRKSFEDGYSLDKENLDSQHLSKKHHSLNLRKDVSYELLKIEQNHAIDKETGSRIAYLKQMDSNLSKEVLISKDCKNMKSDADSFKVLKSFNIETEALNNLLSKLKFEDDSNEDINTNQLEKNKTFSIENDISNSSCDFSVSTMDELAKDIFGEELELQEMIKRADNGERKEAYEEFYRKKTLAQRIENDVDSMNWLSTEAQICYRCFKIRETIIFSLKALELFSQNRIDPKSYCDQYLGLHFMLGDAFNKLGRFEESFSHLKKALETQQNQTRNRYDLLANCFFAIGFYSINCGDFKSAKWCFRYVLEVRSRLIEESLKDEPFFLAPGKAYITLSYLNLAELYLAKKKVVKSREYFSKAEDFFKTIQNDYLLKLRMEFCKARILILEKKNEEAIKCYENSLELVNLALPKEDYLAEKISEGLVKQRKK